MAPVCQLSCWGTASGDRCASSPAAGRLATAVLFCALGKARGRLSRIVRPRQDNGSAGAVSARTSIVAAIMRRIVFLRAGRSPSAVRPTGRCREQARPGWAECSGPHGDNGPAPVSSATRCPARRQHRCRTNARMMCHPRRWFSSGDLLPTTKEAPTPFSAFSRQPPRRRHQLLPELPRLVPPYDRAILRRIAGRGGLSSNPLTSPTTSGYAPWTESAAGARGRRAEAPWGRAYSVLERKNRYRQARRVG